MFSLGTPNPLKRYLREYKFSLGHLILRVLLAGILSVGFFILMFPFLQRAGGLPFEDRARIGEINMWRIVFFYGFFSGIFVFIAFWRKIFRLTALILIIFWLAGSSLVLLVSSTPATPVEPSPPVVPTFTGQELFDAVNSYRKEQGLSAVKLDKILCNNIAQRYLNLKSGIEENVAHKGLDEWVEKYVQPYGDYQLDENYAWGQTPESVIKQWEGSPSHRLSILDPESEIGCAYAAEGHAVIILGQKVSYGTQSQNTRNQIPSRTGEIISYHEWCTGEDISIYENELITKKSSDGNIYTMTQGDWDCYENYLKNKR